MHLLLAPFILSGLIFKIHNIKNKSTKNTQTIDDMLTAFLDTLTQENFGENQNAETSNNQQKTRASK